MGCSHLRSSSSRHRRKKYKNPCWLYGYTIFSALLRFFDRPLSSGNNRFHRFYPLYVRRRHGIRHPRASTAHRKGIPPPPQKLVAVRGGQTASEWNEWMTRKCCCTSPARTRCTAKQRSCGRLRFDRSVIKVNAATVTRLGHSFNLLHVLFSFLFNRF